MTNHPLRKHATGSARPAFHLEEFKLLKLEMATLMTRIETLSRLGLVVAAAVFSWLAVNGVAPLATNAWCVKLPPALFIPAWYIPFCFAVLSGLAALAACLRARQVAEYIRELEGMLATRGWGWESVLKPKAPILTITGVIFWAVLLLGTLAAGYFGAGLVGDITAICPPSK